MVKKRKKANKMAAKRPNKRANKKAPKPKKAAFEDSGLVSQAEEEKTRIKGMISSEQLAERELALKRAKELEKNGIPSESEFLEETQDFFKESERLKKTLTPVWFLQSGKKKQTIKIKTRKTKRKTVKKKLPSMGKSSSKSRKKRKN